ncbi:hypothetical protein OHB26_16450 [Nocardia sp. NBC_01503]|uniref:phage tail fiber protein n=1 Tax=Nocardia sp. NBC_01503 TaxID=2975997 RepID=UPI002E7C14A8|nr:hypothetical protein [Nocardia sp. NBC_01503]WTL35642.1 hypothetical protein OHB26_16450 [Nocardia sp. NBC_01503]
MSLVVLSTQTQLAKAYTQLNGSTGLFLSIHNADPGPTGTPATEATGGSYARQPVTWNPVTTGTATGNQVTMNVPAGTWTYAGLWTAATGGTMVDRVQIASTQVSSPSALLVTPSFTIS